MILKQFEVKTIEGKTITITATNLQDVCKEYGARSRSIREMGTIDIPDAVLLKAAKQQSVPVTVLIGGFLAGIFIGAVCMVMASGMRL